MMVLPDFNKAFDYENNFLLSCKPERISKILTHYELFKLALEVEGAIVECGILKGASFCEFAGFIKLFCPSKKLIGFDTFGEYPPTNFDDDKKLREYFIKEVGSPSISKSQLFESLKNKGMVDNVELIEGDICQTVPKYIKENTDLKISLLNLDVDIFEPSVVILENLWPKIVKGGVLVLDDYNAFPGETKAANDFFKDKNVEIKKFSFRKNPYYVIKN